MEIPMFMRVVELGPVGRPNSLCENYFFAGKKNGINANMFYYLSHPLLKQ
jgi:hypothetical protein